MRADAVRDWLPYCGAAPSPEQWLARWNTDFVLWAALAASVAALWSNADGPRGRRLTAGWAVLTAGLFVSPFCALSSALFSARVAHHVLLAAVLAPLLVWALPAARTRWPGGLAVWTALQALTFWVWHAPPAYAAALSSDLMYWAMQLTIFATSAGFWAAIRRAEAVPAVAALLASTVQMGLLGALITFAGTPMYAPHLLTTLAWGMSPLEDQQLAGLVMWVPSAALYLAAAIWTAHRYLARAESGATA